MTSLAVDFTFSSYLSQLHRKSTCLLVPILATSSHVGMREPHWEFSRSLLKESGIWKAVSEPALLCLPYRDAKSKSTNAYQVEQLHLDPFQPWTLCTDEDYLAV